MDVASIVLKFENGNSDAVNMWKALNTPKYGRTFAYTNFDCRLNN